MARFDRDGRPIPDPVKPSRSSRRSPHPDSKWESAKERLAEWRQQIADLSETGEKRPKPVTIILTMAGVAIFGMEFADLIFEDRSPLVVTGSEPARAVPQPFDITAVQAARWQDADPEGFTNFLRSPDIVVRGMVAALDVADGASDRVALDTDSPRPIQLDVEASDDPAIALLSVGEAHRFRCSRGAVHEGEVLLFDCRYWGKEDPEALAEANVPPPVITVRAP
ncbi:hypothetical protein WJT74_08625 [Sphingomicrobium sp. XHP0239]|uniref:hypothetical protein n=1 Tax=Sphingomicrobium maritimum TaxID=3133972 RepID=UPI0031CCAA22